MHPHRRIALLLLAALLVASPATTFAQQPTDPAPPEEQPAEGEEKPAEGEAQPAEGDEEPEDGEGDPDEEPTPGEEAPDGEQPDGEPLVSEEPGETPSEVEPPAELTEEEKREAEKQAEKERFEQLFGIAAQALREKQEQEQGQEPGQPAKEQTEPFFIPADPDTAPQLDYNKPIQCSYRPGSKVIVHMQCDHKKKNCLVAEEAVFRKKPAAEGGEKDELVPSDGYPEQISSCYSILREDEFSLLVERGYTFTPALLEIPFGYKRDERGRAFQTHFDLRSRLTLGVYYAGLMRDGYTQSLALETRSSYEHVSSYKKRRHRFSFIEGELVLSPLQARAKVFDYNYGRLGDEPLFYITTLLGTPKRHDVYMRIGKGITVGELDYRAFEGKQDQTFLNLLSGRLQWEIFQGLGLEDYLMLSLGSGMGTRSIGNEDAGGIYYYPELGFKAMVLKSPRGLFQFSTEGTLRYGFEAGGNNWQSATASASLEWILLAISDQPISLYARPEARYLNVPSDDLQSAEARVMAGVRFNFFAPAPEDPVITARKLSGEGY